MKRFTLFIATACALGAPLLAHAQSGAFDRLAFDGRHHELRIDLPAADLPANIAYDDHGIVVSTEALVPTNLWLHGFDVDLVDGAGRPLPKSMLHHVSVASADQRELFNPIMLRVAAAGAETEAIRIPHWIGMPLKRGERLMISAMLHNPTMNAYAGVRVRLHFDATSKLNNRDAVAGYPFHMHVTPPGVSWEFDVPPGVSTRSWEGSPAITGRVVGLGGHLHQYGVSVQLEDVTANQLIYRAVAVADTAGEIVSIPRTVEAKKLMLYADHVYRVTAVYNNPTDRTVPNGGMGIVAGMIVPRSGIAWPRIDASNPTYAFDRTQHDFANAAISAHHH